MRAPPLRTACLMAFANARLQSFLPFPTAPKLFMWIIFSLIVAPDIRLTILSRSCVSYSNACAGNTQMPVIHKAKRMVVIVCLIYIFYFVPAKVQLFHHLCKHALIFLCIPCSSHAHILWCEGMHICTAS